MKDKPKPPAPKPPTGAPPPPPDSAKTALQQSMDRRW